MMDHRHRGILQSLSETTPAQWCQAFFLVAAAAVLAVAAMPDDAKTLLVDYGARKAPSFPSSASSSSSASASATQTSEITTPKNLSNPHKPKGWWGGMLSLMSAVTSWSQVPHSWFGAFYALSVGCSLFWLGQYLADGHVWRLIASKQVENAPSTTSSVALSQVAVGWTMMFLQGARRVFEHAAIIKPSKSTMWAVHWLLGLFFYLFINVSIWVEGSGALLDKKLAQSGDSDAMIKLALGIPAFMYAWVNQYRCHKHLANLKKYSLPEEGLFQNFICAHYTCECFLYFSMAIATAPNGAWCNRTLLCAVIFVSANLGVTASGTRKWYAQKFGVGRIANRWNMVPFIF